MGEKKSAPDTAALKGDISEAFKPDPDNRRTCYIV